MPKDPDLHHLESTYVRLEDETATLLEVDSTFWEDLAAGKHGRGGWLVSQHVFEGAWEHWEAHPLGEELVYLVEGAVDFELELPDGNRVIELRRPGSFVVVPRGVWHIGRALQPSTMLFLTAGEGTEHRRA